VSIHIKAPVNRVSQRESESTLSADTTLQGAAVRRVPHSCDSTSGESAEEKKATLDDEA